jgi:PAP2 superfamily
MSFESFRDFAPSNRADVEVARVQGPATKSAGVKTWVVPAAAIISVEYVFALLIGFKVGFHYRIPFESYAITGVGIAMFGVTVFIVCKFVSYAAQREPRPARRLLAEFPGCYGFVCGTLLVAVQMAILTWTKIMLPLTSPFWADPLLADIDHVIFRADPWKIAGALFGWAAPIVDGAYVTWVLVKFVTLAAVLAAAESRKKTQALLSYFLILACTALGQYLLSSGGPVFYERLGFGGRFEALPIEPWVKVTTSYLWNDYLRAGGDIGTGISAMPSLHVAIALWFALVMRSYLPRAAVLGYLYFALILIGSVLLGWHYAADGIAAIGITLISWRAAGIAPLGKRRRSLRQTAAA